MKPIVRRLRQLETRLTDATGCAPYSERWFDYWEGIIDRLGAGEEPVFRGRVPLEVVDRIIERADRGRTGSVKALEFRLRRLETRLAAKIESEQPGAFLHIVVRRIGAETREIFLPMRRVPGGKR